MFKTTLSRNSLSCCTCGAISEPKAAVAIKHPPPFSGAVPFSGGIPLPELCGSPMRIVNVATSGSIG